MRIGILRLDAWLISIAEKPLPGDKPKGTEPMPSNGEEKGGE
jgi:hypothetical protein